MDAESHPPGTSGSLPPERYSQWPFVPRASESIEEALRREKEMSYRLVTQQVNPPSAEAQKKKRQRRRRLEYAQKRRQERAELKDQAKSIEFLRTELDRQRDQNSRLRDQNFRLQNMLDPERQDRQSKSQSITFGLVAGLLTTGALFVYYEHGVFQIKNIAATAMGTTTTNSQFQALMHLTGVDDIAATGLGWFLIHYIWLPLAVAVIVGLLTRWVTKPAANRLS